MNILPTYLKSLSNSDGNVSDMDNCLDRDVAEAEGNTEDKDNIEDDEDNDESGDEEGNNERDLEPKDGEDVHVEDLYGLDSFVPL
ncbi:hypothetical protein AcW1_001510 [Taiwanofungus camphoratus]|nr:hypothetical protein AcV5_003770 [Antrodia cinnamomea]KAI0945245.1 hypothetical protein AcW1_001510 [Antrodia cinnamomea]